MSSKTTVKPAGTRPLAVKLTGDEKVARGNELAQAEIERSDLEATFKATAQTFRGERKELDNTIMRLSRVIEQGEEVREVECSEELDPGSRTIRLIRNDTLEEVGSREATDEELQGVLFEGPQ